MTNSQKYRRIRFCPWPDAFPKLDGHADRSKYWIKVKNRKHPAMDRVMEAFR